MSDEPEWTPTWLLDGQVVDDGTALYQSRKGRAAYPRPQECRNEHSLLGAGVVQVGSVVCVAVGTHRTYRCRRCGDVIWAPEPGDACDHVEFDGRGREQS